MRKNHTIYNRAKLLILLLTLCLICACEQTHNVPAPQGNTDFTAQYDSSYTFDGRVLGQNVEGAAQYLLRNIKESGRFNYRQNVFPAVEVDKDAYNELRHLGAIYALGQYAELADEAQVAEPMARAGNYMRKCCLDDFPLGEQPARVIWSTVDEGPFAANRRTKLGGTGLGILAFLAINRQMPDYMDRGQLQAMARGILAMQRTDGSFESIYEELGKRFNAFNSLFYPGEAILALLQLYQYDASEEWLTAALAALRYLSESRQNISVQFLPSDHWTLLATAELFAHIPSDKYAADRELFRQNAIRLVERMILAQRVAEGDGPYFGSFNNVGNTTPIGTKMEGMIAIGPYLDNLDPTFLKRYKTCIMYGLHYLQDAIVREGPHEGAVMYAPYALHKLRGETSKKTGRIQIDNVQHVMSAWYWAIKHADWLWAT